MEIPFEKPPMEPLGTGTNWGGKTKLSSKILPLRSTLTSPLPKFTEFKTQQEKESFLKTLKKEAELGNGRIRFWNMLVSLVERAGYKPPQDRQTIILNLGCGNCREGMVLNSFFGGRDFGASSDNVKLIGVDIREEAIEKATKAHLRADLSKKVTEYALPPNYAFIVGDATNLNQYPEVPNEVDVVVIRHEQISDSSETWTKIFQQAIQKVSKDGIIIITSYSDEEHNLLIKALDSLDCEIVIGDRNKYAEPTNEEKVSVDRNVAIVKRKN